MSEPSKWVAPIVTTHRTPSDAFCVRASTAYTEIKVRLIPRTAKPADVSTVWPWDG